jgi:hypothetical protein
MRDLSSAIEALAEEMEKAGRAARVPPVWIDRLRAILAECEGRKEEENVTS